MWDSRRALLLIALVAACRDADPVDASCTCTPANTGHIKSLDEAAPMDGVTLLARLRRHRQDVANGVGPRDIKVIDDQLRFAIVDFCQPCASWVTDRLTVEEMFPLEHLDQADHGICLGLVLRDGTTVYGAARPRACR